MNSEKTQLEINSKQDFSSLMEYFKTNKFLSNDSLCQMVVLKSLSEYKRYSAYKTSAVLAILEQASKKCKPEANRKSSENLLKKLSVMNTGKPAPQMQFINEKGESVYLSDYKGKYLYVNFWASWCTSCIQEMTLIPELKKMYGNKIRFISISFDKSPEEMKNFLKKNPKLNSEKNGPGWIFLYCDNYKKAKEGFNVLTVPTYYLIDPKGNVFKSPAANPIDVEPVFMKIKKKQQ